MPRSAARPQASATKEPTGSTARVARCEGAAVVRVEVRLYTLVDAPLRAESGHGLGRLEVLRTIAQVPDCRVSDLVSVLGVTVGAASKAADRQVPDGFVRRTANPQDGRSSFLALTSSGRALLAEMLPVVDRAMSEVLTASGVTQVDLEHLTRSLGALREVLESN